MKIVKRSLWLICLLAIAGIFLASGYVCGRPSREPLSNKISKNTYEIGRLLVDVEKRKIHLTGRVVRTKGWVQFLFYAPGYLWLKEESAIIIDADLSSLQTAMALLDWKLWQQLWEKRSRDGDVKVKLNWENGNSVLAPKLLKKADDTGFSDLIFVGSPYFDEAVLGGRFSGPCSLCPLFTLEERALRKEFIRPSGKSGYFLDEDSMPPKGISLKITIELGREN
ncbi:MAG: hypothetical protein ACE5K3_00235 [bacterium]